jgi:hypothetical protein
VTGPEREDELESFLQQRSLLPNRLANAERFEPPEELDRVVLTRAREAIRTAAPTPTYRASRWAFPFGLAATLVLAFAVIFHMGGPTETPIIASAPTTQNESAQVAMDSAAGTAADASAPAPPPAEVRAQRYARELKEESALSTAPASPALADAARAPAPTALAKAAPAPPPAAPDATTASTAQEAARGLSEAGPQEAPVATAQANAIVSPYSAADGEEQSTSITGARAAKGVEADSASSRVDETTADDARLNRRSTASSAAVTPEEVRRLDAAKRAGPARWLEEIQRLRREGKQADSERELADFRKAYPDYPAPADTSDPRPSR